MKPELKKHRFWADTPRQANIKGNSQKHSPTQANCIALSSNIKSNRLWQHFLSAKIMENRTTNANVTVVIRPLMCCMADWLSTHYAK